MQPESGMIVEKNYYVLRWNNAIALLLRPSLPMYERLVSHPEATWQNTWKWTARNFALVGAIYVLITANPEQDPFFFCFMPLAGAVISALSGVAALALTSGICHLIARRLNGLGTFNKLVYAMSASFVPVHVVRLSIDMIFLKFGGHLWPFLGLAAVMELLVYGYQVILWMFAIKATHKFEWTVTILVSLIPTVIIFGCIGLQIGLGLWRGLLQ